MGVRTGARRLLVGVRTALATVVVTVVVTAGPAGAHAELRSSQPVDGEVVDDPPSHVVLQFSEPVEVVFGAVRVYDGAARRVDVGPPRHPGGDRRSVSVSLPELANGSYVVTWRMTSADAHSVRGALTFRTGLVPPGEGEALARRLLAAQGGSAVVGALVGSAQAVTFASLAVLVGGVAFVRLAWPAGTSDRRLRRILWWAWAALAAATLAGLGLQVAAAAGLGVADAFRPSLVASALDTRAGRLAAARLGLLAVAALLLPRRATAPLPAVPIALVGAALLATVALSGHAGSGRLVPVAVVVDLAHLGAISLWLGGLVVVGVAVLRRPGDAAAEGAVGRFSSLAFGSVIVIVATGAFQGWRQVGSLAALTGTTYGRLLVVKVALVAALVALGAASRSVLRRRARAPVTVPTGPGAAAAGSVTAAFAGHAQLRRRVRDEVAVSAAVLVVASLLVGAVPGRTAYGRPFSAELDSRRVLIDVTIDPARAGPADMHVYTLDRGGQVADVEGMEADLRLAARDVGPLRVPLRRAGPGHFAAYGFSLPLPGTWELTLTTSLADGSERVVTAVPVR